jgi:hypothetical protein
VRYTQRQHDRRTGEELRPNGPPTPTPRLTSGSKGLIPKTTPTSRCVHISLNTLRPGTCIPPPGSRLTIISRVRDSARHVARQTSMCTTVHVFFFLLTYPPPLSPSRPSRLGMVWVFAVRNKNLHPPQSPASIVGLISPLPPEIRSPCGERCRPRAWRQETSTVAFELTWGTCRYSP